MKWESKLPNASQTATACWLKPKWLVWGLPLCSPKAKCFSGSLTFLDRAGEFSHSLPSQFSLLGSQELGLFASSQFSLQQHLLCLSLGILLSLGTAREQFGSGQGNLRQTMKIPSEIESRALLDFNTRLLQLKTPRLGFGKGRLFFFSFLYAAHFC